MKFFFYSAFIALIFNFNVIHAQGSWTYAGPTDGAGTSSTESGRAICSDASGNVYMTGVFNSLGSPTDFDLSASSTSIATSTNPDGFISSYDKNGNFRWKIIFTTSAGDFGIPSGAICTDGTNIWFTGSVFVSVASVTDGTGANTAITGGAGSADIYVAKFNCSNGALNWQAVFGGVGANDSGSGICIDPSGNCYVSGSYSGTFTLNGFTAPAPGGSSDFFIGKFNAAGTLVALNTGGSVSSVDMSGGGGGLCYVPGATPAIVATGSLGASLSNFGSFTGLSNSGGTDCVLLEMDLNLNYTNAMVFGSSSSDELTSAVYDPFSGGVFVCGFDGGSMTFTPTPALTNSGGQDIIIARYSVAANNFVWSASPGGTANERGWCITADGYGGILMSGITASAPCTFSGSVSIPSNAGSADIFVIRYTSTGTPVWVLTAASATQEEARGITSYVQSAPFTQSLFITGYYNGAMSFGATALANDGGSDFFLAKINDASLPLTATQSQVNLTCNGVCTGSGTVVASGGTAPYTYSWSPSGGSGATASSLCATNYTCTITDAASASITKTFNVTQPSAITSSVASQTNVACFGGNTGSATIASGGGTGTLTYNWTPGNPTGDGSVTVSNLTAQTWTCTITDANSCTKTQTVNITAPPALSVTPSSQTNIACFGGSTGAASINIPTGGAGGYTYNWAPGNPTGDGTVSVTGLSAVTWTCTVTDANSCTGTQTFNVTAPPALSVTASSQTNIACFGGSTGAASINTPTGGAGGYTYNWTPGNPAGDGTVSVTGLSAVTWTCTVTDANSCTGTQTFNVTAPPALSVTASSQTNVACLGGSNGAASINTPTGGAGGYTYNWTPGNPTGDGTIAVVGLVAQVYTVTVTDANGCSGTQTFNITEPPSLVSGTNTVANVTCFGGSNGTINLTPSGGTPGYTFNWLPSGPSTEDLTGLTAGTYTVEITDANGCTATSTIAISEPTVLMASSSATTILCNGGTADITVSATGGTGAYTGTGTFTLPVGTYSYTVTDSNGCAASTGITVSEPAVIISSTTTTSSNCGNSNGTATVTASGGTGSLTYLWSTSGTAATETGLTAGSYTVTITDDNACTSTDVANVSDIGAPTVTTSSVNGSCHGSNDGSIDNTITGGFGIITYSWDNSAITEDISMLAAGVYNYVVTDGAGCQTTGSVTISEPSAIDVTTTSPGSTITANNATATSYQWMHCDSNTSLLGETNQSLNVMMTGNYAVIISEGFCVDTSDCVFVLIEGISSPLFNNNFISIYPNPNIGTFTLKATVKGTYKIVNELGQTVVNVELNAANNYSMNVEGLSNGVYFVTGYNNKEVVQQKIVVTR